MQAHSDDVPDRLTVLCPDCGGAVGVRPAWAGREAQCPHCRGVLRVPTELRTDRPVLGERAGRGPRYRFNFGCPRCGTLLEAHTGRCGQPGTCPTCNAHLVIPGLDERTQLPRPATILNADAQDPTPLHAYAASGDQAPQIQRLPDGQQVIVCPRCGAHSPLDADSCASCGAPYTLEAAPTVRSRWSGLGAEALVLGIVSLPLFFAFVPGLLAIFLGGLGLRSGRGAQNFWMALTGLLLGVLSVGGGLLMLLLG